MRQSIVLPWLSALLILLTMPSLGQWWASWIGFAPIFVYIFRNPKPWRDTLIGFCIGVAYMTIGIQAFPYFAHGTVAKVPTALIGSVPLVLFCSLLSIAIVLHQKNKIYEGIKIFLPGCIYVVLLLIFEYTPIASAPSEIYFYQPLSFMQLAVLGNYILPVFLILSVNAGLALLFSSKKVGIFSLSILLPIVIGSFAWGTQRLENTVHADSFPIAIGQPVFPSSIDWRIENIRYIQDTYRNYASQASLSGARILFLPGYDLSWAIGDGGVEDFFSTLASDNDITIALGTYTGKPNTPERVNVGLVFDSNGINTGRYYAKTDLPFRNVSSLSQNENMVAKTTERKFAMLLCYDSTTRRVVHEWLNENVDFFVTLESPDRLSGESVRRSQYIQDQLRAIETGKEVVRISVLGPSAVIDEYGQTRDVLPFDEAGVLFTSVEFP